jgi:hypothetical protein
VRAVIADRQPEPVVAKPSVPKFATTAEAEKWMASNISRRLNLPPSTPLDTMQAIAESTSTVIGRFDLPPMEYIGTVAGSGRKFKLPEAGAAAAWRDDVKKANYIFVQEINSQNMRKVLEESSRTVAQATPMPKLIKKIQSKVKAGVFDDAVLSIAQSQQNRRWAICETMEDIYTHEMGHILSFTHRDARALRVIAKQAQKQGWGNVLSEYGNTNVEEFIAESFTAYMKGERSILNPDILRWFEQNDKEPS